MAPRSIRRRPPPLARRIDAAHRRGVGTLEALLVIPAMILVLFATVQFGLTSLVGQGVQSAANEAAREAGKGAPAAQVAGVVHEILNRSFGLQVAQDSGVRVDVDDGTAGVAAFGDTDGIAPAPAVGIASHQVRVCVQVDLGRLIEQGRLPDSLKLLGVSFSGRILSASSLASKQVH